MEAADSEAELEVISSSSSQQPTDDWYFWTIWLMVLLVIACVPVLIWRRLVVQIKMVYLSRVNPIGQL